MRCEKMRCAVKSEVFVGAGMVIIVEGAFGWEGRDVIGGAFDNIL